MSKVGVIIIATNKYISFIPQLYQSIKDNFLKRHDVKVYVLTDQPTVPDGVIRIPFEHRPWPYSTLMRFSGFIQNQHYFSDRDYLFYIDADTRVIDVGEEILSERVGTIHPGWYYRKPIELCYERNPISTAYIKPGDGQYYYFGTFFGGSRNEFLKMSAILKDNVEKDLAKDFIAVWHDESHMNRYFVDNPPTNSLHPGYGYPESWNIPYPRKILALDKNHLDIRT
jgi:histo-blood group ABO system transferase